MNQISKHEPKQKHTTIKLLPIALPSYYTRSHGFTILLHTFSMALPSYYTRSHRLSLPDSSAVGVPTLVSRGDPVLGDSA